MKPQPVASAEFLTDPQALLDGLQFGRVGLWRWRIDTDVLQWTPNLVALHRMPKDAYDGTLAAFQNDIHPDDAERVWLDIRNAIEAEAPYRTVYRIRAMVGEQPIWIEATGGVIRDRSGQRYLTGACFDVTNRVMVENQLKRRIKQQEGIERLGTFALQEADLQKVLDCAVEVAADVFDVPLAKVLQFADAADSLLLRAGVGWKDGLVGVARVGTEKESQAGYTLLSDDPVIVADLRTETRFSGPPLLHEHGVRSGMSVVIAGSGVRPFGVFGIHATTVRPFDALDLEAFRAIANLVAQSARQAESEEHRTLLMREMAHRSGNLLQMVNVIANQTFAREEGSSRARQAFSDRLASLARANHLITRRGWAPARLIELLEETLKPFWGRFELKGRDILLPSDLCFDIGLVLHELATNSAKYGSLGTEKGRIAIAWQLGRAQQGTRRFRLEWIDPLSNVSEGTGSGFGRKLKAIIVERKWHGTMTESSGADGYAFRCEMDVADHKG